MLTAFAKFCLRLAHSVEYVSCKYELFRCCYMCFFLIRPINWASSWA